MDRWLYGTIGAGKKTDVPRTHNKMGGGSLYISESDFDEFHHFYAEDFDSGNRSRDYSEIRTSPMFKMFFDIDLYTKDNISEEDQMKFIKVIQLAVVKFFDGMDRDQLKCIVCTTQSKKEKGLVKCGIHLNYPHLNVNKEMALQLRYTAVSDLEIQIGNNTISEKLWEDVLDQAPYREGVGLKMCGSSKKIRCPECSNPESVMNIKKNDLVKKFAKLRYKRFKVEEFGPKHEFYKSVTTLDKDSGFNDNEIVDLSAKISNIICNICHETGKISEGRWYMPTSVLSHDGIVLEDDTQDITTNTLSAIKMTSIRCGSRDQLSPFAIPPGVTPAPSGEFCERTKRRLGGNGLSSCYLGGNIHQEDAECISTWKRGEEVGDDKSLTLVQHEIRKMRDEYGAIVVNRMWKMELSRNELGKGERKSIDYDTYKVLVKGDGATFCMNKSDYHTSNTCYFIIIGDKIRQYCFSKKICSKYRSNYFTISEELFKKLYPERDYDPYIDPRITYSSKKLKQTIDYDKMFLL